jgi:hypothetical protein
MGRKEGTQMLTEESSRVGQGEYPRQAAVLCDERDQDFREALRELAKMHQDLANEASARPLRVSTVSLACRGVSAEPI